MKRLRATENTVRIATPSQVTKGFYEDLLAVGAKTPWFVLEAFRFYAEVLGGKIEYSQSYGESPMKDSVPKELQDRVMHASLILPDGKLMGADAGPWSPFKGPIQSCSLSLHYDDAADGKRVFDALSAGGTVVMPFEKTFWADGFGMLTDKFGVPWMVNCCQNQ